MFVSYLSKCRHICENYYFLLFASIGLSVTCPNAGTVVSIVSLSYCFYSKGLSVTCPNAGTVVSIVSLSYCSYSKGLSVTCPNGHKLVPSQKDNRWRCDGRLFPSGCRLILITECKLKSYLNTF